MIGWVAFPAGALGLIVLQTTFGRSSGFLGVYPDFLLLSTILVGMRRGETVGAGWGMLLGFLQDAFSAGPPGLNLLTKGLLGYTAGLLRDRLDCENPNTQSILGVTATLAEGLGQILLLHVVSAGRDLMDPFVRVIIPAAVVHGILLPCGPALWQAVARRRRFQRERRAVSRDA